MPYEYACVTRDGHTLDVLTDHEHGLRIEVSRLGAELISLARKNEAGEWIGFLWRDADVSNHETGWKNHSTVMGYFTHRIKDEVTSYCGHEMRGSTHSFIRTKTFDAPKVATDHGILTYHLPYTQIMAHEYPFRVSLDLTYRLHAGKLYVQFYFTNGEVQRAAKVSFGLHPGFGITTMEQARILFPGGSYIRHASPGNFLSGEKQHLEFPAGDMPFPKKDLIASILLELKQVLHPLFVLEDPPTRRRIEIDMTGVPYLTVWSDGHPFVCLEPCWGLPDHHNQKHFESKEGIQTVAPRGTLTKIFSITPKFLENETAA